MVEFAENASPMPSKGFTRLATTQPGDRMQQHATPAGSAEFVHTFECNSHTNMSYAVGMPSIR